MAREERGSVDWWPKNPILKIVKIALKFSRFFMTFVCILVSFGYLLLDFAHLFEIFTGPGPQKA